jgi:HK97 family phage prohead protease
MHDADLAAFRRTYGLLGETERRSVPLTRGKVTESGSGDGRLKIVGHAAVFNSPSVELASPLGKFVERIAPHAFDRVLASKPDTLLTWDHSTLYPLARTSAGTLELSVNAHGLRYFASVTPTSYAEDLRSLMNDGVVNESSFTFTVAPDGQTWEERNGVVTRTITKVQDLFDVCVTCSGAYPATDSGIARTLMLDYALSRGFIRKNPDGALAAAKLKADLELRRRRYVV